MYQFTFSWCINIISFENYIFKFYDRISYDFSEVFEKLFKTYFIINKTLKLKVTTFLTKNH